VRWLFESLAAIDGHGVRGRTVLDFACASGYVLFEALKSGAASGIGIDARDLHVQQGQFLAEATGCRNVQFRKMDTGQFLHAPVEPADTVLFLDTLQAVADPIAVLNRLGSLCMRHLVVTVILYVPPVQVPLSRELPERQALMLLRTEDGSVHNKKGVEPVVLTPTYEAVLEMIWSLGFPRVLQLIPPSEWNDPSEPLGQFGAGKRAAFVALRDTPNATAGLSGSAVEILPGIIPPLDKVFPLRERVHAGVRTRSWRRFLGRRLASLGRRIADDRR